MQVLTEVCTLDVNHNLVLYFPWNSKLCHRAIQMRLLVYLSQLQPACSHIFRMKPYSCLQLSPQKLLYEDIDVVPD